MIHITGDTHGDLLRVGNYIKREHLGPDDIVIIAGDFGVLWHHSLNINEAAMLSHLNTETAVCFVDGNHENFDRLDSLPTMELFGSDVGVISHPSVPDKEVYHLCRGRVYNIQGKKIFTMGGGVSIDKDYRTPGVSWWDREIPSGKEIQKGLDTLEAEDNTVDYVISHAAPQQAVDVVREGLIGTHGSFGYGRVKLDTFYGSPVTKALTEICDRITFEQWFFGHYHFNSDRDARFVGLYEGWKKIET